jgi:hypothetical protein
MAAFRRGQEYRPPYDQGNDAEAKAGTGLSRDNSYPTRKPNVYGAGPPMGSLKGDFPPTAIDCSYLDGQTPDAQGFDDGKGKGGWLKTKSDEALGGFTGDLLPKGRAGNHPTRSSKNAR